MEIVFSEKHTQRTLFRDIKPGSLFLTEQFPDTLCLKWDLSQLVRLDGVDRNPEPATSQCTAYPVTKLTVEYES